MNAIKWALLADGSSDRVLEPIIRWTILKERPGTRIIESSLFIVRGSTSLEQAIQCAITAHRPDILFVHRDAESVALKERREEIPRPDNSVVRVVPVRMTEAWLLIDDQAIRTAASNPNGRIDLALPSLQRLEGLDAKKVLREAILRASELATSRKKRFSRGLSKRVHYVADAIEDFSPLEGLSSFRAFRNELGAALSGILDQ